MNNKKFAFGKFITLIVIMIFVATLFFGFYCTLQGTMDTTFTVASLSTTGTIMATTIVFYQKKAQAENIIKLRTNYMKETAKMEIKIYGEMLDLKRDFEATDEELAELSQHTNIDEFLGDIVVSTSNKLDELETDAESTPEIQNV